MINQKPNYNTGPRIDAQNPNYTRPGGNVKVNNNFSYLIL